MDYFENESGLDPAEIAQASPQGIDAARPSRRRSETEVSDVSDLCRLLRACRGRPRGGNTAKQHDEVARRLMGLTPRPRTTIYHVVNGLRGFMRGRASVAGSVARGAKAEGAE